MLQDLIPHTIIANIREDGINLTLRHLPFFWSRSMIGQCLAAVDIKRADVYILRVHDTSYN